MKVRTEGKRHWCGRCGRFVLEKIVPVGYYRVRKIVCPHCGAELGTPPPELKGATFR